MLDGDLFEKLEHVAKDIRRDSRPFGGIQVILCGDFHQLPPVCYGKPQAKKFAFQSECWDRVVKETIELTTVFRQRNRQFSELLGRIRRGAPTPDDIHTLRMCSSQARIQRICEGSGRNPAQELRALEEQSTVLMSRNDKVDRHNDEQLRRLPGQSHTYHARDEEKQKGVLKNVNAPQRVDLKVKAQVMLLKNMDVKKGLVNGSRGEVIEFVEDPPGGRAYPLVRFHGIQETQVVKEEEFSVMGHGNVKAATRHQ